MRWYPITRYVILSDSPTNAYDSVGSGISYLALPESSYRWRSHKRMAFMALISSTDLNGQQRILAENSFFILFNFTFSFHANCKRNDFQSLFELAFLTIPSPCQDHGDLNIAQIFFQCWTSLNASSSNYIWSLIYSMILKYNDFLYGITIADTKRMPLWLFNLWLYWDMPLARVIILLTSCSRQLSSIIKS